MIEQYENSLSLHEDLNAFINKQELFYSSSFDDFDIPSDDFLEWISPKFYASYEKEILNGAQDLTWKVTKLMTAKLICTAEYVKKCEALSVKILSGINTVLEEVKTSMDQGNTAAGHTIFKYYTKAWMKAFNALPAEHTEVRERFAQLSYDIAIPFKNDSLKEGKESNVEIFDNVFMDLPDLNCSPELKVKIESASKQFIKKVEKAVSTQTIIGVVVLVLIILKWIWRFAR